MKKYLAVILALVMALSLAACGGSSGGSSSGGSSSGGDEYNMGILKQTTFNCFLATGMLLCLITAGIDLSVGANAVFCACLMGTLKEAGVGSGVVMMIAAIVAGGLVGCINGTLLRKISLFDGKIPRPSGIRRL